MPVDNGTRYGLRMWLFIAAALVLILVLALSFYAPLHGPRPETVPTAEATPSTEWTTAPESPGIPVRLPETPMHTVVRETPPPTGAPKR